MNLVAEFNNRSEQVIKAWLDAKVEQYHNLSFITHDPISIPHAYTKKQDIEIAGFLAAIFSWGKRKVIIDKCTSVLQWMDKDPYHFVMQHSAADLKPFFGFKHRTFQSADLLYMLRFFKWYYHQYPSLEQAFTQGLPADAGNITEGLVHFQKLFFSLSPAPKHLDRHICTPAKGAVCKRLNMFLRWMVRKDSQGVDFGLWPNIRPSQLIIPGDVHVLRVSRKLQLLLRKQNDWQAVVLLTEHLKKFCPHDPLIYDFALFGLGIIEKFA